MGLVVVGGASSQLQHGRAAKYLGLALKDSLKGWHSRWFYVANPDPALPAYIGRRSEQELSWFSSPSLVEEADVKTILNCLKDVKAEDQVSSVAVVRSFIGW